MIRVKGTLERHERPAGGGADRPFGTWKRCRSWKLTNVPVHVLAML
jgi:hypothetical protein